jgi:taurine dioxygenase
MARSDALEARGIEEDNAGLIARRLRMVEIVPIDGAAHGANAWGVDLNQPLGGDLMKTLADALYEHRVLVIKNQTLDQPTYLDFGAWWGTPIPHVLDHMRMPGYPALLAVGNTEEKDKKVEIRNGAALWHTDQSYEAVPASATMLYSILVPKHGGQTRLADMVAAYDALDDPTKAAIDGLEVAHLYGAGKLLDGEFTANPLATGDQIERVPTCHHPLVLRHPVTGRKALYATGQSSFAIKGMADREAVALLWKLKTHAIQDRFVYAHAYAVGDIAIFDTFSTMHAAVPIEAASAEYTKRLLWRISVRGLPRVYAHLAA